MFITRLILQMSYPHTHVISTSDIASVLCDYACVCARVRVYVCVRAEVFLTL